MPSVTLARATIVEKSKSITMALSSSSANTTRWFVIPGVVLLVTIIIMALTPSATARSDGADEYYYNSLLREAPENYEEKSVRNLDGIGGGNLLRDLSLLRNRASHFARQRRFNLDSLSGDTFGQNKRFDSYPGWGNYPVNPKRNMDEMDRSGFSSFIKKKNFDEIDRAGFDSFVKRNFDEMDRAGFGSFVKRDLSYQQNPHSSPISSSSSSSGVASSGSSQNHN